MRYILTLLLFSFCIFNTNAQEENLGKFGSKDRNKKILKTAKKVVKQFGPDFYKMCNYPSIQKRVMRSYSKYNGKTFYEVKFFYTKEDAQKGYPSYSTVWIWEDTGRPSYYSTLSMTGIDLDDDKYEKAIKQKKVFKKDGSLEYTDSIGNKKHLFLPIEIPNYVFPKNKK